MLRRRVSVLWVLPPLLVVLGLAVGLRARNEAIAAEHECAFRLARELDALHGVIHRWRIDHRGWVPEDHAQLLTVWDPPAWPLTGQPLAHAWPGTRPAPGTFTYVPAQAVVADSAVGERAFMGGYYLVVYGNRRMLADLPPPLADAPVVLLRSSADYPGSPPLEPLADALHRAGWEAVAGY